MRFLIAMSLVAVGLAGCSDSGSSAGDPSLGPNGEPVGLSIPAPEWQIGDWWTYQWSSGQSPTLVVSEDLGADWHIDVSDREAAFAHAAFDEVSTFGAVSKDNLDGSQGSTRVKFFDFPLEPGKQWTTEWDGLTFQAEAHVASSTVAHIAYSLDGAPARNVVYDGEKGWMRSVNAIDEEGAEVWSATLMQSGQNYNGEFYRYNIHDSIWFSAGGFGSFSSTDFDVPAGSDVWYRIVITCSPDGLEGENGAFGFKVGPETPPEEPYYSKIAPCPANINEQGIWEAPVSGRWTADVLGFGGTVEGTFVSFAEEVLTIS